ncbi:MAG: YkgJ family cysteine cluster protein [Rhodospirillaceae bacterium]|jgi:Fe-S-cluster containining protein|nr:YkgJ family cysteine cluster protein [Rhodospirillaceae bacterium]MBT4590372.1 YkgJ family cysteine cluster protein [Rhodospirillaceae bacterium]MBT7266494.1 YkgJ family cysteine cluster protein [Rhodospirillaceae bacterium]
MAKTDEPDFEDQIKLAQSESVTQAFAKNHSADGLADIGIDAIDTTEAFLKRFYQEDPPDQLLACVAGCTFCCHQYVGLSMPELAILTKYINTNFSAEQKRDLIAHLSETLNATSGMSQFERAASRIDCPLLDPASRQCTIYSARPLTCRAMHSLDRDACEMDDATPGKNHAIPQYESHKGIVRSVAIGLQLGIAESGIEPKEMELASALLKALSEPEAIEDWIKDQTEFDEAMVPEA